jgi:hypothetical protein
MNCLSWNCRGLGNPSTVRELRTIVKQEGPSLLFIMETKIKGKKVENLQRLLGFAGCFAVDSNGLSGGIGLFWDDTVEVELKNYSQAHIDVEVKSKDQPQPWRFTGFYGEPRTENRYHSWNFLRTLHGVQHNSWLCMGDFNETLYSEEHFSLHARPEWQMRAFREAVDFCSLQDLGWRGVPFTWDNKQQGNSNVKARLDRAFANASFLTLFEFSTVKHISSIASDHCYILAELRRERAPDGRRGPRLFRYENVWQSHSNYYALVKDSWQVGAGHQGLEGIVQALESVQNSLGSWGDREFGNISKKVRKLQKQLERLRAASIGRGPNTEELAVCSKLQELLRQEEVWLKQRSRVQWLRKGDRNTKYYQAQAKQRARCNRIVSGIYPAA